MTAAGTAAAAPTDGDPMAPAEELGSQAPYPGLRHFRQDESDIFFGREAHIDELLRRLDRQRFLGIVGVSGCGKSSLVRAGMVPALETGLLARAGVHWTVIKMRPGNRPLRELSRELGAALPAATPGDVDPAPFIEDSLRRGPFGLRDVLQHHGFDPGMNLLLVVDQFEEIFRYRRAGDANEADAFVALLLASAAMAEFPVYVVLAMRSDYLGECALFCGLPEALNDSQFLTPRLTREQRRAAIEGPAGVFGAGIEPALVNHLLNDMGADPDQLPLMQHLLMRMWDHARRRTETTPGSTVTLTLDDYEAVGGFGQALQQHVDEVFLHLDAGQRSIAEILFRAATERVENKQDSRRPVPLGEVAELAGVPWQRVAAVVEAFRGQGTNFLLPPDGIALDGESIIDLTHESLIRQWPRLVEWVRDESQRADIYRKLEADACEWQRRKRPRDWLLRSGELDEALTWRTTVKPTPTWARRYGGNFALLERYLRRSVRGRRWRRALATCGVVGCIALAGMWAADVQKRRLAQQQRDTERRAERDRIGLAYDLALQSAATRNLRLGLLETSTLLAVEAVKRHPSLLASQALLENLRLLPPSPLLSTPPFGRATLSLYGVRRAHLAFADSGHHLLAVNGATVQRFTIADGTSHAVDCPSCAEGEVLAADPGGRYVVVAAGGELRAVDVEAGRVIGRPFKQALSDVDEVAISSDGRTIVVRSGGVATLHGVDGRRRPSRMVLTSSGEAVLDPEARLAATWGASGGRITIRDLRGGGREVFNWNVGALTLTHVAFSPDGRHVAATTQERVMRVWDVHAGYEVARFNMTNYPSALRGVALAGGASHLAVSTDEAIRIFDIRDKLPREMLRVEGIGEARSMRFGPDARQFAVLTPAGLNVWPVRAADGSRSFDLDLPIHAVALSQDKRLVAAAASDEPAEPGGPIDGLVAVWEVESGTRLTTQTIAGPVAAMRFVDPTTLAFGDGDGRLHRLRLEAPPVPTAAAAPPPSAEALALECGARGRVAAISGNGQRIAVVTDDATVCLHDGAGAQLTRTAGAADLVVLSGGGEIGCAASLEHRLRWLGVPTGARPSPDSADRSDSLPTNGAPVLALAISDDGRAVAVSSWRKGAEVVRPALGARPVRVASGSLVESLALNRDGSLLVTGGGDANLRVWSLSSDGAAPRELARIPQRGPVNAVALSADDELVISASGSSVRLQPWRHLDLAGAACKRIGRDLTEEEWEEYLPGVPYETTCGNGRPSAEGDALQLARQALDRGNIDDAVAHYRQAAATQPLSVEEWNELCWQGALWGYAQQVLFACDEAVAGDPDEAAVRDSRGLAYALVGNTPAAIAEFRFVVERERPNISGAERQQRRMWLAALERGQHPFSLREIRALQGF